MREITDGFVAVLDVPVIADFRQVTSVVFQISYKISLLFPAY